MIGGSEPDDDPAEDWVEDELQDLVGSVRNQDEEDDSEVAFDSSCGGKHPPDHPDADVFDDLDL